VQRRSEKNETHRQRYEKVENHQEILQGIIDVFTGLFPGHSGRQIDIE
jgi:hypothetical protein